MTKIKDPVSFFSHAFGAVLAVIGLVFLIIYSAMFGEGAWDIVSFTIFGVALILLYTFSSLYHLLNLKETGTKVFRKFDHIMIYIFIAASYTPICLGPLRGGWGWSIFGVIWGLAIFGVFLTIFWLNAPRWLTTGLYLAMGWTVIIATYPLITTFANLNALGSLLWLLAGGIFYTIGGILYGLKWPKFKNKYFGFHELFHIFILLRKYMPFYFYFLLFALYLILEMNCQNLFVIRQIH